MAHVSDHRGGPSAAWAVAVPTDRALYLQSWDRLRVFAALDTVALHLTGTHALFGVGLPLFLMLSVALAVAKPVPPLTERFVRRRFDRIVLPWAFWAVALFALDVATSLANGEPALGWIEPSMIFYGPRIHLWFLPFIAAAGVLAHVVHKHTRAVPSLSSALVAMAIGVALLPYPPRVHIGWPYDQWVFSLPAIFLGYAVGRAVSAESDIARLRLLLTAGYALFGAGVAAIVALSPDTSAFALRYVGGLGLLVAATWLPNRPGRYAKMLVPLMLGVYLLHPVVWSGLVRPLVNVLGLGHVLWLRVAIAFPLTMAVVWALRRTPARRFL